jgi:DHA3 family macrolide efflux protein-like MFS transporter
MRSVLKTRPLRLVFTANIISMMGSGMNSAAVMWFILQATHSEVALGMLVVLQTIPSMLMLPFTGVIIDREDRRHLVMLLDAARAIIILTVAVLALRGRVQVWHLYVMNTLVQVGFWMFWPTINALVQELTPEAEYVKSSTFLMAGIQGGFLLSGAVVGFVYNHVHLGGVLLIDFCTYLVSLACYLSVRKGRHIVARPEQPPHDSAVARYLHEMREGIHYLRHKREALLLGVSWALYLGAMMASTVVMAPLSDRILHAGATGYGWIYGAWGLGACLSAFYVPALIRGVGARRALQIAMAVLAAGIFAIPYSRFVPLAVLIYMTMGSARGVGGISISSSMMHLVPKHFMGRVQNTFYFAGTGLQITLALACGFIAHRVSLSAAFAVLAAVYALAFLSAVAPVPAAADTTEPAAVTAVELAE